MRLSLRFPRAHIPRWAALYPAEVDRTVTKAADAARRRGHLTRREFLIVGDWKTPRARQHRERNSEAAIRRATRIALATDDDVLKIEALRALAGVEWPTATAILHLCDPRGYPILDTRALWSAGVARPHPRPGIEIWMAYTRLCRKAAAAAGCSMRDLDRALWQYSKAHES
jgi:hypothetical protein